MTVEETSLSGLCVIHPKFIEDSRGSFREVYRQDQFEKHGLPTTFVQINHSVSKKNVLRGLHFQWDPPLGKFIRVIGGEAFVACVDLRKKSKTFRKWLTFTLSAENRTMLYVPFGFASGFCVPDEYAEVEYLYTALYNSKGESNIRWDDPELAIPWPLSAPELSPRDKQAGTFQEWISRPEADMF